MVGDQSRYVRLFPCICLGFALLCFARRHQGFEFGYARLNVGYVIEENGPWITYLDVVCVLEASLLHLA
jgi:hypothetical protein